MEGGPRLLLLLGGVAGPSGDLRMRVIMRQEVSRVQPWRTVHMYQVSNCCVGQQHGP